MIAKFKAAIAAFKAETGWDTFAVQVDDVQYAQLAKCFAAHCPGCCEDFGAPADIALEIDGALFFK